MKTTILLSTQRSGTTFFDRKICGLCGFKKGGGELLSRQDFELHNSSHLLEKHSESNGPACSDKKIKSLWADKDYFFEINKDLLPSIVSNSNLPMFNTQYNFIDNNFENLDNVDTPIIHLIRQNSWRRAISLYVMKNKHCPPHILETQPERQTERAVTIDKNEIIRMADESLDRVLHCQDKLKNKDKVMTLYYEDIAREEYWTEDFISRIESFMGQKFTNKEYKPPNMKVSNFIKITNEEEIIDEEYIKKYFIDKI